MYASEDDLAFHFAEADINPEENPDCAYQESVYISFADLDQGVGGVWRIGLEHNQEKANCCATLWREGSDSYRYFNRHHRLPRPDWADLQVGVLRYHVQEPLKKIEAILTDAAQDLSVELSWTAATPIFDFASDLPAKIRGWATQHYQQFGHFEAKGKWRGDSFDLSGVSFRDHSWGIRDWERGWDWAISGGVFLRNETTLYVWRDSREGRAGDGGLVLSGMDPERDTRVDFHLSDYEPVLDPAPIVTELSYKCHTPSRVYNLQGRLIAPTLVMPFGKAHFTTALFKFDVDGETAYGIVDNFGGHDSVHDSEG
jgi:hypothetical protein